MGVGGLRVLIDALIRLIFSTKNPPPKVKTGWRLACLRDDQDWICLW